MKKKGGSLYGTMFLMVIIPMAIVTVVASFLFANYYKRSIALEVMQELKNICSITRNELDRVYPGDYELVGDQQKALLKGDAVLNGDNTVPDAIKAITGAEIDVFYYDTRILTTIMDSSGSRIVGTGANAAVMRDVYEAQTPAFYNSVTLMDVTYYAYYEPLFNSDGTIIGMLFAGKPTKDVIQLKPSYIWPMVIVMVALIVLEGVICMFWTKNTISHIEVIQEFLVIMSEGKFSKELSPVIIGRDDEIGRLAQSVIKVQGAIRDLIEKDMLTGLNNRRFGYAKLEETQRAANKNGIKFCVTMCDIDFFKHFNDTYGHDAGDLVLKEVARLFKNEMAGKGFAVRWGGEEFLLVFTDSNMDKAKAHVEAIRQKIKALELKYMEETLKLTMSFGMADGSDMAVIDSFLKEADDRLYYAKEHGRDQVVTMIPWWTEKQSPSEGAMMEMPANAALIIPGSLQPAENIMNVEPAGAEGGFRPLVPVKQEEPPERKTTTRRRGRPKKVRPPEFSLETQEETDGQE